MRLRMFLPLATVTLMASSAVTSARSPMLNVGTFAPGLRVGGWAAQSALDTAVAAHWSDEKLQPLKAQLEQYRSNGKP